MTRTLLPSLNSCFVATHVISFKVKQDGSRALLILQMDFAARWGGKERGGCRKKHQTHHLHKHAGERAHTHLYTRILPEPVLLLAIVQTQLLSINQACCKAPCHAGSFSVKFDEHGSRDFRLCTTKTHTGQNTRIF